MLDKKRFEEMEGMRLKEAQYFREIKYSAATKKRHEKSWKEMLLKIAVPRLKNDLEYAWQNFERLLDAKDFTISLLIDELQKAEKQASQHISKHIDNIDDLIILCHDQINELKYDSKNVIDNISKTSQHENKSFNATTKENEEVLRTMLYALNKKRKEDAKMIRGEYISKQDVEICRLTEHCNRYQEELECKYEKMWKESVTFLKDHILKCQSRRRDYHQLKQQDEAYQKLISQLWSKFRKYVDKIKFIRHQLAEVQYEQNKKITQLSNERNHFEFMFKMIKKCFHEERDLDKVQLMHLTLLSNNIINYLQNVLVKGEKILKLAAICRKYETVEEKTLSFPSIFIKPARTSSSLSSDIKEDCKPEMDLFWARVSQADCLRFRLNEELEFLKCENKSLKNQLHSYCMCLTCNNTDIPML